MGTFTDWLDNITDPSLIEPELYQALQALDQDIDLLYMADHVNFDYDVFFSDGTTNIGEALREIADYLAIGGSAKQLVQVPSYGTALVDATMVFNFLCLKDATLGTSFIHLDTAAAGTTCVLQIMKNATSEYQLDFVVGDHGPIELDLSFINVVRGDRIGIKCVTASGAAGLSFSMEY